MNKDFYTFSEYIKKDQSLLTPSMEDYVEMIYRISGKNGYTRINELSNALNVQPPSVTKMIKKLADAGLVNYERYGIITLTQNGKIKGHILLTRHNIVQNFLKSIGLNKNLLEQTEKIEHTINEETLNCMIDYLNFLNDNPDIKIKFEKYKANK